MMLLFKVQSSLYQKILIMKKQIDKARAIKIRKKILITKKINFKETKIKKINKIKNI